MWCALKWKEGVRWQRPAFFPGMTARPVITMIDCASPSWGPNHSASWERCVPQRQNRLTEQAGNMSWTQGIVFFFFQNGRERWFWEAEAFPFPTTRAGEVGLSSPPADTRVRWGSGQKIIAQPLQSHSRPINFSWALLWTFTSGRKKGKIWLKDDRFCKHLSDCVYKWFKLLFIFTRHWTLTCVTYFLSCGKKATVACVLWVHTEAYLISKLIALRYLQMLYITL